MLFNSFQFIFVFLPIVLVMFFVLGRYSRSAALGWVVVASLVFYGWWRPVNVLIIGVSLFVNFAVAYLLLAHSKSRLKPRYGLMLLAFGIVFDLCFLGYFKYVNFARETLNELVGTDFVLTHVVLPLGISFITFQKIAFLIDVHSKRIDRFRFREFILFILFFPQLIAGPIVHFREMMPQFRNNPIRLDYERLAVGLSLFVFGLFKKVVLADGISAYVSPVYEFAANNGSVTFFTGWMASVGFTLQMYFDFSGYSDMAAGLALCFGVRLPLNFDSPLKAGNIVEFWSRWHITLTRFLTAYIYNPLAIWLTRRRLKRGLAGVGAHNSSVGAFVKILAFPTLVTMTLSGLWHGAGYLFIIWGLLHGLYLVTNHAWRIWGAGFWKDKDSYNKIMRPVGFPITFLAVAVAMVLFRSTSVDAAIEILSGMFGVNGISLPALLLEVTASSGLFSEIPVQSPLSSATDFVVAHGWLVMLTAIALYAPNSAELMSSHRPVLEDKSISVPWWPRGAVWQPNLLSVAFISLLAAAAILRMAGPSEFLYWQF